MAFGLGIPCGACGCDPPCDPCTRTCQNPHTGTEFEAVFTRYFEGAESGNVSDGYLTASGDSDTSDPYDGMDGSGPWHQQITGSFTVNSTQTRFPCRVLVSFWRNNYTLGAATIPPASTALTSQKVYVTVTDGAVVVGDLVIVPADGEVEIETVSIPLVTGGGDQSGNIPRFYEGSVSVAPQCESASFSIRARIEWSTQKRQHVLYGLVRECYEIGTPCATACSGSAPPSIVYLEISNAVLTSGTFGGTLPSVTFALDRASGFCHVYITYASECNATPLGASFISLNSLGDGTIGVSYQIPGASECGAFVFVKNDALLQAPCASGVIASGTGTWQWIPQSSGSTPAASGTLDWEVSA